MKKKENLKEIETKKILIYLIYANLNVASDRRSRSSPRMLRSSLLLCGSHLPLCPPGQESSWTGNQERPISPIFPLLKVFQIAIFASPLFLSLLSPWCGLLHTSVDAVCCSWSALDLPASDWWRTPSTCWCLYLAGEMQVDCVHIVVHTTSFLVM